MSAAKTALSSLRPARQRNRLGVCIRGVQMSISVDSVSHLLDQRRRAGPTFVQSLGRRQLLQIIKIQRPQNASEAPFRCLLRVPGAIREPQKVLHFACEQPRARYTDRRVGRRADASAGTATPRRTARKAAATRYSVRAAGRGLLASPAQKSRARGAKPTHRQPEAATAPPAIIQTKVPQPRPPKSAEAPWGRQHRRTTTRRRHHQYH